MRLFSSLFNHNDAKVCLQSRSPMTDFEVLGIFFVLQGPGPIPSSAFLLAPASENKLKLRYLSSLRSAGLSFAWILYPLEKFHFQSSGNSSCALK
jgi:hypothetical protein